MATFKNLKGKYDGVACAALVTLHSLHQPYHMHLLVIHFLDELVPNALDAESVHQFKISNRPIMYISKTGVEPRLIFYLSPVAQSQLKF